jgi:amino acid adenylation domain-containing protein
MELLELSLGSESSQIEIGNIVDLFHETVERFSDSSAIEFEGTVWSYEQTNAAANRIAHDLIARGLGPEERIGICLDRSPEAIVAMLGILKAGCAFVPLDPEFPKDRLAYIVADAHIHRIFCDPRYKSLFDASSGASIEFVDVNALSGGHDLEHNPRLQIDGESLAYVMYTSGSTGKPKGVQIEHRALQAYCLADINVYRLTPSDRTLQFSTLNFDIAIEEIFPPLIVGSTVVVRPRDRAFAQNELSHLVEQHSITALHIATAYWNEWVDLLVASDAIVPPTLRLLIATGEKVSVEHYRRWKNLCKHDVLWCNAYGPTETTVTCTVFIPSSSWDGAQMPIGKPLDGYSAHILDDQMRPVQLEETGHLFMAGPALARGYLNRDDLTQKAFLWVELPGYEQPQRLYRTGDLARWLPTGDIEFSGRVDHQMKIGSYRIEPGEIEAVLSQSPDVRESLVVCDESNGQKQLVAYIARTSSSHSSDPGINANSIMCFLRERLPAYMIPARYIFIENFPKTINGKIDRPALPAPSAGVVARTAPTESPLSDLEKELASIWINVLNVPTLGRNDDFFLLGGSSLLVTRVIAQMATRLKRTIPVRDFFANPTIASLCAQMTATGAVESDDIALPIRSQQNVRQKLPSIHCETIQSRDQQLAAIYYPPLEQPDSATKHIVVLCNAHGHEGTRAYRNLQQLAILLCRRGFGTLRFDFACTGNSSGPDEEASLDQWRFDVLAAVEHARTTLGATSVSIVGVRLGAALALQCGARNVKHAILWDPVTRGDEYLEMLNKFHQNELRCLSRFLVRRKDTGKQLFGFAFPNELSREMSSLKLDEGKWIEARHTWLIKSQGYAAPCLDAFASQCGAVQTCDDQIYWEDARFTQSAFASPKIFGSILDILSGDNSC